VRDPVDQEIFKDCQMRIHSMALVHDRLYRSSALSTVDFGAHLSDLVNLVARSQSRRTARVDFKTDCDSVEITLDTAIPLGLIAVELVTNAYKHAFTNRTEGRLDVTLKLNSARVLVLTVTDSGGNLPAKFEIGQTKSLGMRLVENLARQLRAKLTITSTPGVQTSATIALAEEEY
jgi:two-component sensor histidine kinase